MNTQPVLSVTETQFRPATTTAEGIAFHFDLGTQRRNWTHARWAFHEFENPVDLSDFHGVALEVITETPRSDAGVYLAFREQDGSWYSHPWAVHLAAVDGRNRGIARFADFTTPDFHQPPNGRFQDANEHFDVDAITAVAVGVVNPLGVGEVSFTLTRMDAVTLDLPEDRDAAVRVSGRLVDINNTEVIPSGLFGGFNLGRGRHERFRLAASRTIHHDGVSGNARLGTDTTPMHINTIGDRVRPSPRLTRADWEARSEALGRRMGQQALEAGRNLYAEYWNEPYLNWANFNRANFIPRFYDISRAEEGGPVHIRHDGAEAPHLIWTRDRSHFQGFMIGGSARRHRDLDHWRRGRTAEGRVLSSSAEPYRSMESYYEGRWLPASHPPLNVPDGETYTFRDQTLTAFTPWHIVDTTQFTYWSGKGMLKLYIDPMIAFARGMKEANPDSVYIVGWGNRPSEDHWAGFFQLYQPVIDAGIEWIDAYNDHDYGGDPRNMSANYEVVTAYGVTRHDKWLYAYNTEAGNNTDPQVYRDQPTVSANVAKFHWVTRKMMHALSRVPDKARVFLHFGDGQHTGSGGGGWWSDRGEGICMEMLINLRGRLLHSHGSHDDLYVVAAVDSTDSYALRPDFLPDRKEWVVAVFNDRQSSRNVHLDLTAPAGAEVGEGTVIWSESEGTEIAVRNAVVSAAGGRYEDSIVMGPRELRVFTFPILNSDALGDDPAAWPGARPPVRRRQFFGHTLLETATPDEPVADTVEIPADVLARATHAEYGFVAQRLAHGDAELRLNGSAIPLPGLIPGENNAAMKRLPLDLEQLRETNTLEVRVTRPESAGFFFGMHALWVEYDDAP